MALIRAETEVRRDVDANFAEVGWLSEPALAEYEFSALQPKPLRRSGSTTVRVVEFTGKTFASRRDRQIRGEQGLFIDLDQERAKLSSELEKTQGFADGKRQKLANQDFVTRAKPEVVEKERASLAELEEKVRRLEAALADLG